MLCALSVLFSAQWQINSSALLHFLSFLAVRVEIPLFKKKKKKKQKSCFSGFVFFLSLPLGLLNQEGKNALVHHLT